MLTWTGDRLEANKVTTVVGLSHIETTLQMTTTLQGMEDLVGAQLRAIIICACVRVCVCECVYVMCIHVY